MEKDTKKVEEIQLPDGITAAMVADAKKKYGEDKVKFAELPIDDEKTDVKTVLVCVPNRHVTGQWRRYSDIDPKKADEILVNNCLLSHKEEVKADDGLFYAAMTAIASLTPIRQGIIKNC